MRKAYIATLVVVACLVCLPSFAQANLLTNPGFESGFSTPWITIGHHTVGVNSSAAYTGSYGLQLNIITGPGTGDGWGGRFQNYPASEGDIFGFEAMVNTQNLVNANSTLQIAFFDVVDPQYYHVPIGVNDTAPVTGQDWTQLSLTSAPAPATTQAARFVLVSWGAQNDDHPEWRGSGYAYFDDAEATLIPEPSSLILLATGLTGLFGLSFKKRK